MEALVEKLCNRFSGVTDGKQWEYISYSLSLLTFTEKGIKKLIESFKSYEHALAEDLVTENFRSIINKGKKFAKPELKACIEEFEEKINKFHMEKKEQEETARNAEVHREKTKTMESLAVLSKVKEEPVEEYDEGEGVSDSEIVDPSMEESGDNLVETESEEEPSDSEEEPDSAQCGTAIPRYLNQKTSGDNLIETEPEEEQSDSEPDSAQCGTTNPRSLNRKTSGDNLIETESEEEQSDSEEEPSDSEEEPDSAQCGTTNPRSLNQKTSGGEEGESESKSTESSSSIRRNLRSGSRS
jgi:condensin complex subunit 1